MAQTFTFQLSPKIAAPVAIVAGLALMAWGGAKLSRAKQSSGWPTTEGMVIYTDVDRVMVSSSSSNSSKSYKYYPEVEYEYQVDGKKYSGDDINFATRKYRSSWQAREAAEKYPIGEKVTVYYDPASPRRAVLETGTNFRVYAMPGAGFFIFLAGIGTIIGGRMGMIRME